MRGKAFEKIISCLSKIEEALMEGGKKDEGDKANYEQGELTQEDIDLMIRERKVC